MVWRYYFLSRVVREGFWVLLGVVLRGVGVGKMLEHYFVGRE